jgi:hypothetical protein
MPSRSHRGAEGREKSDLAYDDRACLSNRIIAESSGSNSGVHVKSSHQLNAIVLIPVYGSLLERRSVERLLGALRWVRVATAAEARWIATFASGAA